MYFYTENTFNHHHYRYHHPKKDPKYPISPMKLYNIYYPSMLSNMMKTKIIVLHMK
jgi:hypothetical protein